MVAKPKTTKDARLELRISADEKDLFERAAAEDGRSLSGWIRFVLLRAAGGSAPAPAGAKRRARAAGETSPAAQTGPV